MKKNLISAVMMTMMVLMTACSVDDAPEATQSMPNKGGSRTEANAKTVLVYMAGKNSLNLIVPSDLREIKAGSKRLGSNDNLLVFVCRYVDNELPWLARIKNGEVTDSVSLSDMGIRSSDGENRASDPVIMEGVMRYAFDHYPSVSGHYGLVLWGHGSGWLINDEVLCSYSRAFGVDYGKTKETKNARWINIPTMTNILKRMPHLKFIMGDCCNLMCLENLYEMRNVCDYIIGSPAEIPGQGAPYDQIVPDMFADGNFYSNIISKYYSSVSGHLPLTAIQTCEMENLAQATRQTLQSVKANIGEGYADMKGLIHYYHTDDSDTFLPEYNIFYDAGDFIRTYAPKDQYEQWRQALSKAIVAYRSATNWETDLLWQDKYTDFTVTEEKMHGVSMFVKQDPTKGNYAKYNADIKKMEWYGAVGLNEIGW